MVPALLNGHTELGQALQSQGREGRIFVMASSDDVSGSGRADGPVTATAGHLEGYRLQAPTVLPSHQSPH